MSLTDVDLYIFWLLIEQKVVHHLLVIFPHKQKIRGKKKKKNFCLSMLLMVLYFHLEMDIHCFYDIFNTWSISKILPKVLGYRILLFCFVLFLWFWISLFSSSKRRASVLSSWRLLIKHYFISISFSPVLTQEVLFLVTVIYHVPSLRHCGIKKKKQQKKTLSGHSSAWN